MSTLIITDVRVHKIGNDYYVADAFYRILQRYSIKFSNLSIITRIIDDVSIPKGYKKITSFCTLFLNIISIKNALHINDDNIINEIKSSNLVILRLPSLISIFLFKYVKKFNKKYLCEIMGCAWDAFWNHSLIGKVIAPYAFFEMKKIVKNANFATYVTQFFLQKRYPCNNKSIGVSNVNIETTYQTSKYKDGINANSLTMITAAAVDVKYKGQKYVIKALDVLKKRGIMITYYLAGGGNISYLQKVAKKYKVNEQVIFLGSVPHEELIERFKKVDLYIQPSLQEGLPRAVIEAMSCGCVCLGSTTAGIPELLDDGQLFKRRSVMSIVNCIEKNLKYDLTKISNENIIKSQNYLTYKLNKKRYDYYDYIIKNLEGRTNEQV